MSEPTQQNGSEMWRELRRMGQLLAGMDSTVTSMDRSQRDDHACLFELKGQITAHIAREESLCADMDRRTAALEAWKAAQELEERKRAAETRRLLWRIALVAVGAGGGSGGLIFGALRLAGIGG